MADLRAAGIEPVALAALLERLGTSDPVEPVTGLAPLIAGVDFARFGRAPARFDEAELALLNQKVLHHTDYHAVAPRLPPALDETRWKAIRPNMTTVAEEAGWVEISDDTVPPPDAEPPAQRGKVRREAKE